MKKRRQKEKKLEPVPGLGGFFTNCMYIKLDSLNGITRLLLVK